MLATTVCAIVLDRMPKGSFDLTAWARIGAERRLEEIRAELQQIQTTFPDLKMRRQAVAETGRRKSSGPRKRGGRRKGFTMSAEARKAISLAQKRRWRKLRAANNSSS